MQDPKVMPPKEGDLYRIIRAHGRAFEIRYGYYVCQFANIYVYIAYSKS